MYDKKITELVYKAEADYLDPKELDTFKNHVDLLSEKLEVYELLKEEEDIFQPIANQLNDIFAEEEPQKIELALKYWISILRYCGMAMIINNPAYLYYYILYWLHPQIKAYKIQSLSNKLFSLLRKRLSKKLSSQQFSLLKPFIKEIETTLLTIN